jgi:hypothetical protein
MRMTTIERTRKNLLAMAGTVVLGVLCAASLAACGGGEPAAVIATAASESPQASAAIRSVQLEGCVVDQYYVPRSGSPVRVRSADGRLVGDVTSGQYGVFMLRVPARQTVYAGLAAEMSGEALVIPVGSVDISVGACLQHRRD